MSDVNDAVDEAYDEVSAQKERWRGPLGIPRHPGKEDRYIDTYDTRRGGVRSIAGFFSADFDSPLVFLTSEAPGNFPDAARLVISAAAAQRFSLKSI